MRAAVYIRMSTDDQAGSPERQRAQVVPYCERKGYQIVEVYEDLGMRGSDASRPNFQRMLQDARKGRFDIIVVDEQSRLSRADTLDYMVNVAHPLREAGVFVEVVDQGRRLTWERDDLAGQLMGLIGQFKAADESATLGRRVATGMTKRAKEGKAFVGRAAYGFKYRKEDGQRVGYELDDSAPDKAKVVRRIFDAYTNRDLSIAAIVAELNAESVPSPRGVRWVKHSVRGILTNHVYAGCYVWGKVPQGKYYRCDGEEIVATKKNANRSESRPSDKWLIIPRQHTPIVDPELFDKTQKLLVANRPRTSPSRKRASYPFAHLLTCSGCGGPLYGTTRTSGGVQEPVYRCGNNMTRGECGPRVARERVLVEQLARVLQESLLNPRERERLLAELRAQAVRSSEENASTVKALRAKASKLNSQIEKARSNLALLDAENIPSTQAQIRLWVAEHGAAKTELDRLTRLAPSGAIDHLVSKVEKLVEVLRTGKPEMVRSLVRELVERIDLNFDVVQKKAVKRYPLRGGVIHVIGCVDSDRSGPAAGR